VAILPISDKFLDYGKEVYSTLKQHDIAVTLDERPEKIGKKIRDTEIRKVPYMLVIGEKEMNEKTVSIRRQGQGDQGAKSLTDFSRQIVEEIKEYK
jgi:threonyl-tRNA synthetase